MVIGINKLRSFSKLTVVLTFLVSIISYFFLPEDMAILYNFHGEPLAFVSKPIALSIMPAIILLLNLSFRWGKGKYMEGMVLNLNIALLIINILGVIVANLTEYNVMRILIGFLVVAIVISEVMIIRYFKHLRNQNL